MKDTKPKAGNRYISLVASPAQKPDFRQAEIMLQSRVVQLSGKNRGWVWKRPSGVILQQGGQERRYPILDLTRMLQMLLYFLSLSFILAGLYLVLGKRKGALNG